MVHTCFDQVFDSNITKKKIYLVINNYAIKYSYLYTK